MPIVFLGFGSNLGNREKNIRDAVFLLDASGVKIQKMSSIIETAPEGGPPQGLFLNAAAKVVTELSPRSLLETIHRVEADLGRERGIRHGPRTIDIDILLYDNLQLNQPDLVIPHPRMYERNFVMRPLKEVS